MIVLDTNVVSEPMRPNGNPAVRTWLDQQVAETLYLTATSLAELLMGVEILPGGKRKEGLATALSELVESLFESRILTSTVVPGQLPTVREPPVRSSR